MFKNACKRVRQFFFDGGIDGWKLFAVLALSFSAPFMLLFYSPFDIFLHNPSSFIVSWRLLVPNLLLFFSIGFVLMAITLLVLCHRNLKLGLSFFALGILFVLLIRFAFNMFATLYLFLIAAIVLVAVFYFLLWKFLKASASELFLLLVLGVLLSSYVQTLFLNGRMVVDVGSSVRYSELTFANIFNLLVWVFVALLPAGLFLILRFRKAQFKFDKAIVFSAVIMVGMQVVGLSATALQADLPEGLDEQPNIFTSFENALHLSENKNIIVFVPDRVDVRHMRDAFEQHPYLADVLDGFTHFENSVSEFFDTLPSMVTMLTQVKYSDGQTFEEYWDEAWANHNIVDILREHGFTTNLYLDQTSTIGNLSHIENRTDNIVEAYGDLEADLNFQSFSSIITRVSFGRVMPYLLKNMFLDPIDFDFGSHFFSFSRSVPEAQPFMIGPYHDMRLLEFLQNNEFTADLEQGVFNFFHINGAHGGYDVSIDGIVQNFEILERYFSAMRELDVFDSSTIIIISDHGFGRVTPVATSLFIKPAYSVGPLVIDSVTEMSHAFFPGTVLQAAGISHESFGLSYFDILDGAVAPPRTMYMLLPTWAEAWAALGGLGYMNLTGIYEITGYAGDYSNWTFLPRD
jgi:hypothetical protein